MEFHDLTVDGTPIEVSEEATDFQLSFPNVENGYNEEGDEQEALDWCNSAAIRLDEADDAVHVSISVGDPRGAFVMTVRRLPDGTLIMHLPYPESGMLHRPLTKIHEGTYQIG
jgi:hypothetical protein